MSSTGFLSAGLLPGDGSRAAELATVAAAWHVLAGARSRGLGTPLHLRSGPPVWE